LLGTGGQQRSPDRSGDKEKQQGNGDQWISLGQEYGNRHDRAELTNSADRHHITTEFGVEDAGIAKHRQQGPECRGGEALTQHHRVMYQPCRHHRQGNGHGQTG